MIAALRRWWPVVVLFAAGLTADVTFKASFGELGEHAAGHLDSASVLFPGLAVLSIALWATPRARRQVDVWLAGAAWVAALLVVMAGNLRVIDAIGGRGWTEDNAHQLGAGIPAFESGHDLAAVGAWAGMAAAIVLTIVLLARGHISSRVAIGSVALSALLPPFIFPGAGMLVVVVALCMARRRRQTNIRADTNVMPQPSYPSPT